MINGDDFSQVMELWDRFKLNGIVINYYMNHFVSPLHAKQFSVKLQASGWDIPICSRSEPELDGSGPRTTGFSGTNDNKLMLPLHIRQHDLQSLRQTNAEVLSYLLQRRNREYHLAALNGTRLTERGLLQKLRDKNIRILIDAGAYIFEMENRTLAREWLRIDTEARCAVYFDNDNRLWVQYPGKAEEYPLLSTPFADDLEGCLVYFDEAHTRGVDLKLPPGSSGALTLALGQTKDHTLQAAMRLRQLGTTQSVVFFAPPEVEQSILDVCKKLWDGDLAPSDLDSSHVILWLLEQTCCANEHLQQLYIAQGVDFCLRQNAEWTHVDSASGPAAVFDDESKRKAYLEVVQSNEIQTLEGTYGSATIKKGALAEVQFPELRGFLEELADRKKANSNTDVMQISFLEEVEHEREVEFQTEEVRLVQKPVSYTALEFPGLHPAMLHFVRTGSLTHQDGSDPAFDNMFEALSGTYIDRKYRVNRVPSWVLVSAEFMRTIDTDQDARNDEIQVSPLPMVLPWDR
ncbi:hypothetical protein PVAG01_00794 [Phlyctema vagabunda]|uniref:ubiquitinyl hydrolase 1 n=1 Tax=Phlyctema vagabunda TaxID=108571 RepID=A0ABR4PV96_9HELO